jgi:hypothetical protein
LGGAAVIFGTLTFPADAMRMSPANTCTMILGTAYLSINLVLWLIRSRAEYIAPMGGIVSMMKSATLMASRTLRKAPMFAILYLASFMRALWMDPPYGRPQRWAQLSFYAGTTALLLEAAVAALIGAVGRLDEERSRYGAYYYAASLRLHVAEKMFALVSYLSVLIVIIAMCIIRDPEGQTRSLNPAVKATVLLAILYFSVCVGQWTVSWSEDVGGRLWPRAHATLVAAETSVAMCPLVSVLFICCRMRALQITNYLGAPPHWAQNCMYMCTFAIFMQSLCCICLPFFTGRATLMDEDGNATYDFRPMLGAYMVAVVKYVALFCLHGGVLTICAAIYSMTPTSARGDHDAREEAVELMVLLAWIILVVVIALALSSAKVAGLAMKLGIESTGKILLGAEITIARVALSVCGGDISLGNLVVSNPESSEAWESPYVLKVEHMTVRLSIWRLLRSGGNEFDLSTLTLKGVDVRYDLPGFGHDSNVHLVLEKLKQSVNEAKSSVAGFVQLKQAVHQDSIAVVEELGQASSSALTPEGPARSESKAKSGIRLILHQVSINQLEAHVHVSKMLLRFDIADIEFADFQQQLSNSKSAVVEDAVKAILTTILKTVLSNQKLLAQSAARAASAAAASAASRAAHRLGLGGEVENFTAEREDDEDSNLSPRTPRR